MHVIEYIGLEDRNEAGNWLMDFCEANNLSVANTRLKKLNRWLCGHHQMANIEIK